MYALQNEYRRLLLAIGEILMEQVDIDEKIRREISRVQREARISLVNNRKADAQRDVARLASLFERLKTTIPQ